MQALGRPEQLTTEAVGNHDVTTDANAVHEDSFRARSAGDDKVSHSQTAPSEAWCLAGSRSDFRHRLGVRAAGLGIAREPRRAASDDRSARARADSPCPPETTAG